MAVSESARIKCLLWCDRHCCLCKKACGIDIELHHVAPTSGGGSDNIDNVIPLCYQCHAMVEHYNSKHPRGNKWRQIELKKRRDQVYEEFTRHLVPPIEFRVTQQVSGGDLRELPDVGFTLAHLGDSLPVHVRVKLDCRRGKKSFGPPSKAYYSGKKSWHLNPRTAHCGHFLLPRTLRDSRAKGRLETLVHVEITDCYDRPHLLLPNGFVYHQRIGDWYFEP